MRLGHRFNGWKAAGRLAGMLAATALGCSVLPFLEPPAPTATPASVEALHFQDAGYGRRFHALLACIQSETGPDWRAFTDVGGNFYTMHWCRGAGARDDCGLSDSSRDRRDQHILQLHTIFYGDVTEVSGLGLLALRVPDAEGWSASFHFTEGNPSFEGEGWSVILRRYDTAEGEAAAELEIGDWIGYRVMQTSFHTEGVPSLPDDLAAFSASAEAMRDRGLERIRILSARVMEAVRAQDVTTCDYGPYLGKGIPPQCTPRPLTNEETEAELERARTYFAGQERLLMEEYAAMYAAWMSAFPADRCTP